MTTDKYRRDGQIRDTPRYMIRLVHDTAQKLYESHLSEILGLYMTNPSLVSRWHANSRNEHVERLNVHLEELEQRSVQRIGERYISVGDDKFKINVINTVIRFAERQGVLESDLREQEIEYRAQVYACKKVVGRYGIHGLKTREIKRNARKGSEAGSSIGGKTSHAQKKGVHALSLDEIVANGSRGGLKAKKEGKGIFSSQFDIRDAARAGAIARGQVIYSDGEKELIQSLVQNPDYQLLGYSVPRPNWQRIADTVSSEYGTSRQKMSVRKCYEKIMKK